MRRYIPAGPLVVAIVIWVISRHQLRLWVFDRTGHVSWSHRAIAQTFLYTVVPELFLVTAYVYITRREPDSSAISLRSPKFLAFLLLSVVVISVAATGLYLIDTRRVPHKSASTARVPNINSSKQKLYELLSVTFWISDFNCCQSTGLVRCRENPAAMLFCTSSFMPKPLKAIPGMWCSRDTSRISS